MLNVRVRFANLTNAKLPLLPERLHNEYEVLHALEKGDEKAFEALFHFYKDRVYNIAMMYTESTVLSEEIVQDVFVKVWTKRSGLTTINNFSSWLFMITRNRSFNVLRDIARAERREHVLISHLPVEFDDTQQNVNANDTQKLVDEAMKLLTAQQRQAFQLFKVQRLSREETAKAMNLSPNTVKVHLLHALRIIRAYLVNNSEVPFYVLACFPIFLEKI